jgi:hypothetical protein
MRWLSGVPNPVRCFIGAMVLLALLAGCASSSVMNYRPYEGAIPRPDRIIVYDFAATAAELPPEVAIAGYGATPPPATPAQLAAARTLGQQTAGYLVAELQEMGLPAVRTAGQPAARPGDGLLVGYFSTYDPGNATERVVLGFGAGAAHLKTVVRGYLMTDEGLRPLGSGDVEAGSGKMPGGAAPLVVAVATANPIGLLVGGAAKAYGEVSGSDTIDGAAKRTAHEIAQRVQATAEKQGWI